MEVSSAGRAGSEGQGHLVHRDWWIAGWIFVVALTLRLIYLAQIVDVPFYQILIMDAQAYDAWAQRIAAGDWVGSEAFYQAPAYPYLLAVLYRVFGHDLNVIHAVMMGLGALACPVLYFATRILFGRSSGLIAGLLLAVYPPAIFFDGLIGKQTLGLLLMTLFLLSLLRFQQRPRARIVFGAGVLLGFLALTREHALVFAPAIALWIPWRFAQARHGSGRPWAWVGAFLLGVVLVLGPVLARNWVVGDTLALTTAQMGPNFFIGNNPDATGLYVPLVPGRHTPDFESPDATRLAEDALGRPLTRGEVSNYWLGRGFDFVLGQPLQWLRLSAFKALLTWNAFEIADTEDMYVYADWSWLLRWLIPVWGFGLLAPLAAAGVVLAWPRRRDTAVLLWMMLIFTASVALFMVFARMRYPLVPMLLPFAGYALREVPARLRERSHAALAWAAGAVLIVGLLCNYPLLEEERFAATAYTNLGATMLSRARPDEAEAFLVRAESIQPDHADLQYNLAVLRVRQERMAEAEVHLRHMIALKDEDFRGHMLLASVLKHMGRKDEARRHRRRADELDPYRDLR